MHLAARPSADSKRKPSARQRNSRDAAARYPHDTLLQALFAGPTVKALPSRWPPEAPAALAPGADAIEPQTTNAPAVRGCRARLSGLGGHRRVTLLIRQLRFGLQLPWLRPPPRRAACPYPLGDAEAAFADQEIRRWLRLGFARPATGADMTTLRRRGCSPAFVTNIDTKPRLVIDYTQVNNCLEERTFRMDQLADLAAQIRPGDSLFKADIQDAYYHLRLRPRDRLRLAFVVGSCVYIPLCLNCGLKVAPWFFTKAMRPVVAHLRQRGHRVFSYLDDFFGAARPSPRSGVAGPTETTALRQELKRLFRRLGLRVHPVKTDFTGATRLEILGILVDTRAKLLLLSPRKLARVEMGARRLLSLATSHRRLVGATAIRSFAGLANAAAPAVVDARLRLRALFDA